MKRVDKRRVVLTNLVLLTCWVGVTMLQSQMFVRGGSEDDSPWMSDWWFLAYFLAMFGGNVVTFRGSALRRAGLSLLAVVVLAVAWVGTLAFCAHVLGIHYS